MLAAIFVPGPLLAAGSGFLFGPLLGTFVTLGSTVNTGIASLSQPLSNGIVFANASGGFTFVEVPIGTYTLSAQDRRVR